MGYARHTGRRYYTLVRLAEQQALSSLTSREMLKVLSVNPREDELFADLIDLDRMTLDDLSKLIPKRPELLDRVDKARVRVLPPTVWERLLEKDQSALPMMPLTVENLAHLIPLEKAGQVVADWLSKVQLPDNVIQSFTPRQWVRLAELGSPLVARMPLTAANRSALIVSGWGSVCKTDEISGAEWVGIISYDPRCFRYCNLAKLSADDWQSLFPIRASLNQYL